MRIDDEIANKRTWHYNSDLIDLSEFINIHFAGCEY